MADDELDLDELEGPAPLRKAYEAKSRRLTELEESLPTQLSEAEKRGQAKAERKFQAVQLLSGHGFGEPLAEVWLAQAPDVELTAEAAEGFLKQLGLEAKPPEAKPAEGAPPVPPPVTPEDQTAADQFQNATPPTSGEKPSNEEIRQLLRDDPAKAMEKIHQRAQG